MALGVFLLILPVIFYRESKIASAEFTLSLRALSGFFRQSRIPQWILILIVYMMGVTIASTMSRPLLVDLELSLSDIGLMNGVVSFGAGFVGSFVGGFLLKYIGRKGGLIIFGVLIAVAIALWILPTVGYTSLSILDLYAAGLQFAYSIGRC